MGKEVIVMQNDRNVSSDDNKNAVSLDTILNEFDKSGKPEQKNDSLSEAMKKLDAMFEAETEDLKWLDNIMNGEKDNEQSKESKNEASDNSAMTDESVPKEEEIITAENADPVEKQEKPSQVPEELSDDDTKIFTPAGAENTDDITENSGETTADDPIDANVGFDIFEGDGNTDEYVAGEDTQAESSESDVDDSLGRLFGVGIDEDDDVKTYEPKKKTEHKKIAEELGAYEEINMADPDAVGEGKRRYQLKKMHSMISLFGITFFFLVSLYFEISMLGVLPLPEILSIEKNPVIFALADLQVMFFGAMCVMDSLTRGFYSVLDKKFSPGACALTVVAACTIQAIFSAIYGGIMQIQLFCCIGCFAMFMLALYDSLKASADNKAYAIASSNANKYGAYELGVDSLECSPFASHIDLEKAKVITVNKGSVYEGFVGRNEKTPENEKKLGKMTAIIAIVAALVGLFVMLFAGGSINERIYNGITGVVIVLTSSVPLNMFFVSALPKYLAARKGKLIGAALIGQNASEEYNGLSVVSFDDTEVFLPKDVRISSIKTYGGMALDEAIVLMTKIYGKVGGPLSKIFAKMVDLKNTQSDVTLTKVYPDAIEVNVDSRDVCLATSSYLGANGIRIITDSVDAAFEQSHGSILFMVCEGRVLAKFYIKYSMNPVFEKTLRSLHNANLCVGIKTLDPCITNELVFGCLESANYALSVIKGNSANDIPTVKTKVNSGIISLGSVHTFLQMLLVCERTGRNVKINNAIKLISALLCLILSTGFVLTNNGSLNITFCLIIQLFWLIPVAAVSYFNK